MIRILASHLRGLIYAAFNSPTIKFALSLMVLTALTLPPVAVAQPDEFASMSSPKALTLMNGWYNAPYGTSKAEVEVVNGIVHFKGAIASNGTSQEPFVLPQRFRPAKYVFIPVDLYGAQNGVLLIYPNGKVFVEAENSSGSALNFTSLDGASFALNGNGFSTLTLLNGWKEYYDVEFGKAAVKNINGIVHFRGAISTSGMNPAPFVLPVGFRPAKIVQLSVDLCGATKGRLTIYPDGTTAVHAETVWSNAQCFTSLEGVWFATHDSGFKSLPLINGWNKWGFAFQPKAALVNGIVHLQGAISAGTDPEAFVLPSSMTPTKAVFVPVDMCNATKGRLNITPDGYVSVQAESSFGNAQCLTSLDGVSFVK